MICLRLLCIVHNDRVLSAYALYLIFYPQPSLFCSIRYCSYSYPIVTGSGQVLGVPAPSAALAASEAAVVDGPNQVLAVGKQAAIASFSNAGAAALIFRIPWSALQGMIAVEVRFLWWAFGASADGLPGFTPSSLAAARADVWLVPSNLSTRASLTHLLLGANLTAATTQPDPSIMRCNMSSPALVQPGAAACAQTMLAPEDVVAGATSQQWQIAAARLEPLAAIAEGRDALVGRGLVISGSSSFECLCRHG